ncbi:biotin/lipoyl-binding protein [Acidipila rosea]|uniref:Multidrug efflux system membrane fusion protein n=1 Tax=Acidipila rosea TaxID=768535 RepID=A0A4R1L675_9BACT|nr:biotin/lipoyl-binding protein [Acidipila rosea]TCK73624.1 multidrug efflux system membrane fusion protein [Acidipila rosea]
MVDEDRRERHLSRRGWIISAAIVLAASLSALAVVIRTTSFPRTDDAEVFANFIGIAPLVEGPVVKVNVHDNEFVKQGELLYEIDDRPYQYALEHAQAEQAQLEGAIRDEALKIAGQRSGVLAAQAGAVSAEANARRAAAAINEAKADVSHAEAVIKQSQAEYDYANNNLQRIKPLLAKQFVTVDQVDEAESGVAAKAEAVRQAQARLTLAQAHLESAIAAQQQANANISQSTAQVQQSTNNISILDPLVAQRGAREAAVKKAQYDLDNCRVYAPFDARVTNLTISEGAYAHVGQQLFTLIDTRVWWAIANFRETQLQHVRPGMHATVYLMQKPDVPFDGIVDSVGYGVSPDPEVVGSLTPGLPTAQRTLNWVHLASRYPVRVRILHPSTELLRIGETAIVVMNGPHTQDGK